MQRSFNTDIMDDPIFRKQHEDSRLLYLTLYMHRKNHFTGLFQISPEHLALDMRMTVERVETAMEELERNQFIQTDRPLELVWIPEMRRLITKTTDKQLTGIQNYLFGLRSCPLVRRVCETFGLAYPADPFSTARNPTSNPIPTPLNGDSKGIETPPGTPSKGVLTNTNTNTNSIQELPARVAQSVPTRSAPLDALVALAEGLAGVPIHASEALALAFEAPFSASATGLPQNSENAWFGVWAQLAAIQPSPTLEDMRKLGRWWAKGGAIKCRKQRFNYLANVERITEWFAAARAWDGTSDPTPRDDGKAQAAAAPISRPGPAVPNAEATARMLAERRRANQAALAEMEAADGPAV